MSAPASGALLMPVENNEGEREPKMFTLNDIELSRQHRNAMVQKVENDRLARQLRAASSGRHARMGNALLARFCSPGPHAGENRRSVEGLPASSVSRYTWSRNGKVRETSEEMTFVRGPQAAP